MKTTLIFALVCFLLICSCKKEEQTPTDPRDNYTGIWSGKETIYYPVGTHSTYDVNYEIQKNANVSNQIDFLESTSYIEYTAKVNDNSTHTLDPCNFADNRTPFAINTMQTGSGTISGDKLTESGVQLQLVDGKYYNCTFTRNLTLIVKY